MKEKYMKKISTADRVNFLRAWDSCHPAEARVCNDPIAVKLIRPGMGILAKTGLGRKLFLKMINPVQRAIAGFIPLRTCLIDDNLQAAINNDLEQLVLLGAGYDTRPYRFKDLKNRVKVFEVDLREIQSIKQDRLTKAFGSVPDHVNYVPIDFEKDDLGDCLSSKGYATDLKTFFIWEGVTQYIDAKAVNRTLTFVARNSKPGSSLIFDYTSPDVIDGTNENPLARDLVELAQQLGEPFKFGINPGLIGEFLSQRGFSDVEDYSADELIRRYHTPANRRSVLDLFHIVHAGVGKPSNWP